jgi:simple sugar transport system ATP-binding protein
MVELKGIQKYFSSNGVTALDGVDFDLQEGEIHALLGENGAGKSTLMHIMAGFEKPGGSDFRGNPGTILVNGRERRFSSPARALASGIGMVHQHPHHIPGFLVWENCAAGGSSLWLNRRSCRKRMSGLNKHFRFGLPLDSPVEFLSVGQRQKAALLTLLLRNVQYLIFDEPTAVLSPAETEQLFTIFSVLRREGKGIVLISQKIEEILKIADRITVLRQGKTITCHRADEISIEALYDLIFGDESNAGAVSTTGPSPAVSVKWSGTGKGPSAISLRDVTVHVPDRPLIRRINLELERGNIMGIAGAGDSGLETLELAVTGFLPFTGTIRINGTELSGYSAAERVRTFRGAGGTYLGKQNPETALPIRDLLLLHAHRRFQKRGILNRAAIDQWITSVMTAAWVPDRDNAAANAFSGGQLQRLLLTREMGEQGGLLVLSDPGRGLDWQYRKRLVSLLWERADEQTAILVFSTDVDELLAFSDSIAVLRNGLLVDVVELDDRDDRYTRIFHAKERIRNAMTGVV